MGSGGRRSSFGRTDPGAFREKIRKAEMKVVDSDFEGKVAGLIATKLARINSRDTNVISGIIDDILSGLGDELEGAITMKVLWQIPWDLQAGERWVRKVDAGHGVLPAGAWAEQALESEGRKAGAWEAEGDHRS